MGREYASGDMAQVGVGRVILLLAYSIDDRLHIGGSIDIVGAAWIWWGRHGSGVRHGEYRLPGRQRLHRCGQGLWRGRQARFTYKLNDTLTLGGVYQTAGNLGDLKGTVAR